MWPASHGQVRTDELKSSKLDGGLSMMGSISGDR